MTWLGVYGLGYHKVEIGGRNRTAGSFLSLEPTGLIRVQTPRYMRSVFWGRSGSARDDLVLGVGFGV